MGFNRRRSNAAKLGRRAHQWQARAWSVTKLELIAGANCAGSHRTDFGNVWNEMAQQVLNAVAQRRGRRRAARTCAFHVEIDDAILETAERDVAAIVGDCGADPGLDQLLDGGDRGGVRLVEEFFAVFGLGAAGGNEWRA